MADKIAVQFIEAAVEAGFALVDEARVYRASGQPQFSSRVRQDAEEIIADIERRLQRLGDSESRPFHCLITELRNEIAALEREPNP
jgi:aryl-alcohol dehydrogenase-like predicted oxidoreductase